MTKYTSVVFEWKFTFLFGRLRPLNSRLRRLNASGVSQNEVQMDPAIHRVSIEKFILLEVSLVLTLYTTRKLPWAQKFDQKFARPDLTGRRHLINRDLYIMMI